VPGLPESGNPGLVLGSGTRPSYRSPETQGWSWGRERARVTGVRKPRAGPGVGNVAELPESGNSGLVRRSGTCPGYRSPETPGWSWGRERARVTGVRKPWAGPGVGNVPGLPESGNSGLVLGSGTCPSYRSPETPGWSRGRERVQVTGVRKFGPARSMRTECSPARIYGVRKPL
jgi:hypothetical protein